MADVALAIKGMAKARKLAQTFEFHRTNQNGKRAIEHACAPVSMRLAGDDLLSNAPHWKEPFH